jgi:hypothetical protein
MLEDVEEPARRTTRATGNDHHRGTLAAAQGLGPHGSDPLEASLSSLPHRRPHRRCCRRSLCGRVLCGVRELRRARSSVPSHQMETARRHVLVATRQKTAQIKVYMQQLIKPNWPLWHLKPIKPTI